MDLDPLVEVQDVSKRYGTTVALERVSLAIRTGASLALAGRNGAGKSTLVRLLTGLARPDAGEVRFGGEPAPGISDRAAWRARVACVYQKSTILPELSVAENLFLNNQPLSSAGAIYWRKMASQCREELEKWGLSISSNQRAGDLSVGQRQLLEIARALRQGSRFIILDEPTAQLAVREIKQLFDQITRLKCSGVTFLFISHHLQEIYEICERVAVVRDGRLVAHAPVDEMRKDELVAAMVGEPASRRGVASSGFGADRQQLQLTSTTQDHASPIVLDVDSLSVEGVVHDVSLSLRAGERVGLAGLTGSGKSEVGQIVVGLLTPDSGRIHVGGKAVPSGRVDLAWQRGVAYVPPDRDVSGMCRNLSVEENIALPVLRWLSRCGVISGSRRRAMADDLISRLHIKVRDREQAVSDLSGGNQQKVVMARALASAPKVLVLEFPTAGVDIAAKKILFDTIETTNAAVLLISDEIDELALCDRVLVMFAGVISKEFSQGWNENQLVAAIEGIGSCR